MPSASTSRGVLSTMITKAAQVITGAPAPETAPDPAQQALPDSNVETIDIEVDPASKDAPAGKRDTSLDRKSKQEAKDKMKSKSKAPAEAKKSSKH